FSVTTDNKSLSYFLSQTNIPYRQTRWRMFLQSYDFDIIHMPGKNNVLADALSRIYEETPASQEEILIDPTEKKTIKDPSSAMSKVTKHYLHLVKPYLADSSSSSFSASVTTLAPRPPSTSTSPLHQQKI